MEQELGISRAKLYSRIYDRMDWHEIPEVTYTNEFNEAERSYVRTQYLRLREVMCELWNGTNHFDAISQHEAKNASQKIKHIKLQIDNTVDRAEARKNEVDKELLHSVLKKWLKDYVLWRIASTFGCYQKEDVPDSIINPIMRIVINSKFYDKMFNSLVYYAEHNFVKGVLISSSSSTMLRHMEKDGYALIETLISMSKELLKARITIK